MTSCAKACEGVQASIPLGVQKGVLKWLFAGGGWSTPSRVLLVMGPKGVVRGVGATGTLELTPGETGTTGMTGMTAVMIGAGQEQDPATTLAPASSSLSPTSLRVSPFDINATKENRGAYGVSGVVGTPGCAQGLGLQPPAPNPCIAGS